MLWIHIDSRRETKNTRTKRKQNLIYIFRTEFLIKIRSVEINADIFFLSIFLPYFFSFDDKDKDKLKILKIYKQKQKQNKIKSHLKYVNIIMMIVVNVSLKKVSCCLGGVGPELLCTHTHIMLYNANGNSFSLYILKHTILNSFKYKKKRRNFYAIA